MCPIGKEYSLPPPPASWALCAGLVAPKSRGTVTLRSANPADRPIIDAKFLSHPDDVKALIVGIEMCRDIGNAGPLRELSKREVVPGKALTGQAMENFVRNGATTYFHESGSCRMGKDSAAVVDAKLRVHGVRSLRVVDASVFPQITSGNTNAPTIMIAEKAADMLRLETAVN